MQNAIRERFEALRKEPGTRLREIEEVADGVARELFRSKDVDRRALIVNSVPDDVALLEEKKKMVFVAPTVDELQAVINTFAFTPNSFAVGCQAVLDTPRPNVIPMMESGKSHVKEMDDSTVKQAIAVVDEIHHRLLATTDPAEHKKVSAELEEAQKVADKRVSEYIHAVIGYWEKAALKTLARLVGGAPVDGVQATEAKRVASEMFSYIDSIRSKIIILSVLIASAKGNEEKTRIARGLVDKFYRGITMTSSPDFYDRLEACFSLPSNRGVEMCKLAMRELFLGM